MSLVQGGDFIHVLVTIITTVTVDYSVSSNFYYGYDVGIENLCFFSTGKKSLASIRKLYFELKEEVFATAKFNYGCDTDALERLLKREFGSEERMLPLPNGPKLVNSTHTRAKLWFI